MNDTGSGGPSRSDEAAGGDEGKRTEIPEESPASESDIALSTQVDKRESDTE